jgi:predicted AlkP superfamily phosphohydrolase/phosphomutase
MLVGAWATWDSVLPLGEPPLAYIGPGAGIALVGSFLAVLAALISAIGTILAWPLRRLGYALRGQRALRRAKVRRVIILGLDGFDPELTETFLDQGLLPNLARLKEQGTYQRLATTFPPLSPVAWSSFSTGTNPGKHNIFDFISRDPMSYLPVMSSVRIRAPRRRLAIGKYRLPLEKAEITSLRKSKPFWSVLGDVRIFSAVLRVPITFPPDRFHGVQLSAMCVPDLLGTQGTFFYFSDRPASDQKGQGDISGRCIRAAREGRVMRSYIEGPVNPWQQNGSPVRVPFTISPNRRAAAVLKIDGQRVPLELNQFSDWVHIRFPLAPGIKLRGMCRFYLKAFGEHFEMYSTPIHLDPDRPAMPISHPTVYGTYLARQQGPFATLGLAEDTCALSEQRMSEDGFLDQAYAIHRERETMFFDAIQRVRRGMVVCVFDGPDRIQHMFWRFMDDGHPALSGRQNTHRDTIRQMYVRMDELVGKTMDQLDDTTALVVMSDHGFKPFRRGVDLNAWLLRHGYLKLVGDSASSDEAYLRDVDWSRTSAFALGLAGIYINQRGREPQGIVPEGMEKQRLAAKIAGELSGLRDADADAVAIHEAVPRERVYRGPYVEGAPDVVVGYNVGYRVSWESAVGKTSRRIFSDNTRAWSGDHCLHPDLVPGVLFTNVKLSQECARIIDIGPTVLEWLGVDKPAYMDGRSLL